MNSDGRLSAFVRLHPEFRSDGDISTASRCWPRRLKVWRRRKKREMYRKHKKIKEKDEKERSRTLP
jgi:hypothetical protein